MLCVSMLHVMFIHITIGVDFGGQPGHVPPNAHAFITFYHLLAPNILVCPPNIFDKSTLVHITCDTFIHVARGAYPYYMWYVSMLLRDMTFLKSISPCYFWWSFYARLKKRPVAGVNS